MNLKRLAGIVILIFAFIMGCSSAPKGKLKPQSESDSKITQQKLIDNWSEYDIRFKSAVIVFDPKNDDKKILVDKSWGTVKDQEMWTEIVEDNTTIDGNISPVWASDSMTGVREIWGPDNQQYGLIIYQKRWDYFVARMVDENTLRVAFQPPRGRRR